MEDLVRQHKTEVLQRCAQHLRDRGFEVHVVDDAAEARAKVLELVPEGASVGWGGSATLRQIGVIEALAEKKVEYLIPPENQPPANLIEYRRQAMLCDVYLTGTNAISEDGIIVNIDGIGNRVASMIFGPRKVIMVAGWNKITLDADQGLIRAREYAAAINARRFNADPEDICKITTIIEGRPSKTEFAIVLVKEDLGY